ncbi:MAG: C40 family peptidase [Bacteroidales bacterium]|nr:C40 family peptidase [Bacteroidales bacterium]
MRRFLSPICISALVAVSLGMTSCHTTRGTSKQGTHASHKKPKKPTKSRPAPKTVADALVGEARQWLGVPYKWGGNDYDGVDCSGFLVAVYRDAAGIPLPRTTALQQDHCIDIKKHELSVGDILFFSSKKSGKKVAHVGMYVGNNRMIHASSSRGVVEDNLAMNYYQQHFLGVGRVPALADATPSIRRSKKAKKQNTEEIRPEEIRPETISPREVAVTNPAPVQVTVPSQPSVTNTDSKTSAADTIAVNRPLPVSSVRFDDLSSLYNPHNSMTDSTAVAGANVAAVNNDTEKTSPAVSTLQAEIEIKVNIPEKSAPAENQEDKEDVATIVKNAFSHSK